MDHPLDMGAKDEGPPAKSGGSEASSIFQKEILALWKEDCKYECSGATSTEYELEAGWKNKELYRHQKTVKSEEMNF